MATSIAKLAVVLTTDTRQLAAGLKSGQAHIRRFSQEALSSSGSVGALNAGMLRLGAAGVALLSLQKVAKFMRHATEAAGDLRERLDAVNGTTSPTSLRVQYERLWDTIAFAGLPVVNKLGAALDNVLTALDEGLKRDGFKGFTGAIEQLKKDEAALKARKEQAEATAKAEKDAADERGRQLDRLRDRGRELAESLRTPGEILKDTQSELISLFNKGAIAVETYNRGMSRAADEFSQATRVAKEFKKALQLPSSVGAAEMNTQAALSAAIAARQQAQLEAAQLAEARKQTAVQEGIIKAIEEKKPVKFAVGKLG